MKTVGMWAGHGDVKETSAEKMIEDLYGTGVNCVSLFVASGKVVFQPSGECYKDSRLKPSRIGDLNDRDLLEETLRAASKRGIDVVSTVVCAVDPYHAKKFPDCAVVDVYGARHKGALCLNNPDVQTYLLCLMEDLAGNYDLRGIELDYVRFKRSREGDSLPTRLLTGKYCYCKHCEKKAGKSGLDWDRVKAAAREVTDESRDLSPRKFREIFGSFMGIYDLVRFFIRYPELATWLRFRADSVTGFVAKVHQRVKAVNPKMEISADVFYPTLSWQVGQDYRLMGGHLDAVKPMIYTTALARWETKCLRGLHKGLKEEASEGEILDLFYRFIGLKSVKSFEGFERKRFPHEIVYNEVLKAKQSLPSGVELYAGLSGNALPNDLRKDVEMAHKAGADGYYFFSYRGTPKENRQTIKEVTQEFT